MAKIEVIIYDDNGVEIMRMKGTIDSAAKGGTMRDVTEATDAIAALARRAGVYTSPAKHQLKFPQVLKIHDDAMHYCRVRLSDCAELQRYETMLHDLWFLWHDTPDMDSGRLGKGFAAFAAEARTTYATYLMSSFEAYGVKGRDARYTVRKYLASWKRGDLKTATFDAKMDAARERLEMLRRNI